MTYHRLCQVKAGAQGVVGYILQQIGRFMRIRRWHSWGNEASCGILTYRNYAYQNTN